MTNFEDYKYIYTLFESGNKGFIIKEKPFNTISEQSETDAFFEFADEVEVKLLSNQTIEDIGYLTSYSIETHKARIKIHTKGLGALSDASLDKRRSNIMYLITTINKTRDFSDFPRYEPSREIIFFNDPELNEIENIDEFYMN